MTLVARSDDGGVAELRLERGAQRNALNTALLGELRDHLRAIADDPACRAVVLTGAGEGFCAGADLREFDAGAPQEGRQRRIRLVAEVLSRLGELSQPTIAAVHGPAIGAGWGLALACDLCFAAADARFHLPEVAKGFRIPAPLMRRLIAVAGPVRAAEVAYAGTPYDAHQALAAGCVTRVLADGASARAAALELATALAGLPRASVATVTEPLRALASHTPFPPPELIWTEE